MLELQKFIAGYPDNWEQLLTAEPFALNIKRKGNLISFKYNQIKSDFSLPIVRECRGLILEDKTFKVVAYAFDKFFNYGESHAATIDWNTVIVTEKMDGSLIKVYFYDGEWRVGTNGTIDAEDADLGSFGFKNFRQLFDLAASNAGFDFNRLNPNYTYVLELVSYVNQVVVHYDDITLYHIGTRDNTTLQEVEVDIGVQKPTVYQLSSLEDCISFAEGFDSQKEGFVVRDAHYNRIKVKSPAYLKFHYLMNNKKFTLEAIIDIIRQGEDEEVLTYFTQYKSYFEVVHKKMQEILINLKAIQDSVDSWKQSCFYFSETKRKKEFATNFVPTRGKNLFFLAYNRRLNKWYNELSAKDYVKNFGKYFDDIDLIGLATKED